LHDTALGRASSVSAAGLCESCAMTARRVGSAKARNTRLSWRSEAPARRLAES
jgi:hypothetical protein